VTTSAEVGGHGDLDRRPAPSSGLRILLRHADAGTKTEASVPDAWRALSPLGWIQADSVIGRLPALSIARVFASPALRCRQTVVPLARSLSVDVEPRAELAIDADPHRLLEFLRSAETEAAVLCTHRETLNRLFAVLTLTAGSAPAIEGTAQMAKTALWTIGMGSPTAAPVIRYLSPGSPQS
jgi:phosphohistidine phosphatase SixA